MSIWDTYERRIDNHGSTMREVALKTEWHALNTKLKDSLSYHHLVINGEEKDMAVINSDNLNQKTLIAMPGDDIRLGSLVEWMDNRWLVTERDANNEVYTKTIMLQCNHLLKWVDADGIHEQWCIIEDGTKLKRTLVRDSLAHWKRCVKSVLLIAGKSLEPFGYNVRMKYAGA